MNLHRSSTLFEHTALSGFLCLKTYGMRVIVFVLVVILWSCNSDSSEIGSDFFNGGSLDFSMVDSCTVSLSTIAFEKLVTSDADRILLGTHRDDKLGLITASSFLQLSTSGSSLPESNVKYQYCALVLHYDDYVYYDTSSTLTLKAFRVTETIERDDDGYLYNNSQFAYEDTPMGELSFAPRPNKDDSVEIILPYDFGLDLFTKVSEGDEQVASTEKFLKYFKGIALIPETDDAGCILGFAKNPELRVYYRNSNTIPATDAYLSFQANLIYSNNISVDRSGTNLSVLPVPKSKLKAEYTDEEAYLQAGAGLALRVDIPYLRDLKLHENFFVVRAILELYPVRKSANEMTPLPAELVVYHADKKNSFTYQFGYNATLFEDADLGLETYYALDVTSFVKTQIELEVTNENGLVFTMDNFNNSIGRLYMASPGYKYNTQLKIYYTTINN
jgi:hypothetical protein